MRARPTGRERALVVYLPFDEGTGQSIKNRTGKTGPMTMGVSVDDAAQDPAWVAGAPIR
jgi:hypothetical protein